MITGRLQTRVQQTKARLMTATSSEIWVTIFDEEYLDNRFSVSHSTQTNKVEWNQRGVFDRSTWEMSYLGGSFEDEEWLEAVGAVWRRTARLSGSIHNYCAAADVVGYARSLCGTCDLPALFLDSFSIIENREASKRTLRTVVPSEAQKMLIALAKDGRLNISSLNPREFEALVARVLAEMGFAKIELRRYVKDKGIDILAILADGPKPETVVVEVKKSAGTLAMLDRINGVRERENADRALLVSSCHISREAELQYVSRSDRIAATTISEIISILKDSPDWTVTARELWTKVPTVSGSS